MLRSPLFAQRAKETDDGVVLMADDDVQGLCDLGADVWRRKLDAAEAAISVNALVADVTHREFAVPAG